MQSADLEHFVSVLQAVTFKSAVSVPLWEYHRFCYHPGCRSPSLFLDTKLLHKVTYCLLYFPLKMGNVVLA